MQHGYAYGGGTDHNSGSPFYIVRIELSGTMLAANHKVKPFDFTHVDLPSGNSGRSDALHPEYGSQYSKDELEQYQKNQPFAQAEDRLITDKMAIEVIDKDGARRVIERVDVFVDNEQIKQAKEWMKANPDEAEVYEDIDKDKRILIKCIGLCRRYGIPFNQYDSMDRFNLQATIKESVESSIPAYLDGTDWDAPVVLNQNEEEIERLYVSEDMYSYVKMKGKVYVAKNASHYGAITQALLSIHHLRNEEQLERKFQEPLDDILDEIRNNGVSIQAEGRFWCKYNLIEPTGGDDDSDETLYKVCEAVGVDRSNVYVVRDYADWDRNILNIRPLV